MSSHRYTWSLFAKPWAERIKDMAENASGLGYDGVELPVRPGYPVSPGNITAMLPEAVRVFESFGIRIISVAGPVEPNSIRACGDCGVPFIRIMAPIPEGMAYYPAVQGIQGQLFPLLGELRQAEVAVLVQNHVGFFVPHAMALRELLEPFDPAQVGAAWDPAHEALCGAPPEMALDMVLPHLRMMNLKNAFWRRLNGPEAPRAHWEPHWTTGRHGLADWPRIARAIRARGWHGVITCCPEYSDPTVLDRAIQEDAHYARQVFEG